MYIGNIVVWKHHLHLETKNVYRNHTLDIGNIRIRLETYPEILYYMIFYILETTLSFGNTHILETYNETSLTGLHVKYTIIRLKVNDLLLKF